MPDDELGIAGHMFTIEYDPAGPEAFLSSHQEMDEEVVQERTRHSLMDLAGLDTDNTKAKPKRPKRAPAVIERLSADEAEFDDAVPDHFKARAEAREEATQRRRLPQADRRGREEAELRSSRRSRPAPRAGRPVSSTDARCWASAITIAGLPVRSADARWRLSSPRIGRRTHSSPVSIDHDDRKVGPSNPIRFRTKSGQVTIL